ncbi:MAG: uroporphyrinogen decarboxylase [Leptospiraceae bacterium]|nr:uroporphyrinogen decarboxylase [Leptospiraceae bacterium]MDW8305728.1 uroporphyrinogen decarboxylase family protein [Leptospiraceae bacterium]
MSSKLLNEALQRKNNQRPPVYFMRQAGRYHSHYQNLRKKHSFLELCKNPKLSAEVALGPVADFGFDAAILFSDLLFPLEAMGMGLTYSEGPELSFLLKTVHDVQILKDADTAVANLLFQAEAIALLREKLSPEKAILGFVGGPITLFTYATEGSHQGYLREAKTGLADGRFSFFLQKLLPILSENMSQQAQAGADVIAIFDTACGEFSYEDLRDFSLPALKELLALFHGKNPGFPVLYYSRGVSYSYLQALSELPFSALGVDWRMPMKELLANLGGKLALQGNFDPTLMLLPPKMLEKKLRSYFWELSQEMTLLKGYICSLGHGVLPPTPEENVRLFLRVFQEYFL